MLPAGPDLSSLWEHIQFSPASNAGIMKLEQPTIAFYNDACVTLLECPLPTLEWTAGRKQMVVKTT
jgi:hypothetical protein